MSGDTVSKSTYLLYLYPVALMGPLVSANPAELVAAVLGAARHVIAAAVLLDARIALRAGFRVLDDPARLQGNLLDDMEPVTKQQAG
jgi:hypothetical protein